MNKKCFQHIDSTIVTERLVKREKVTREKERGKDKDIGRQQQDSSCNSCIDN